jgi:hypothetical protein
LESRGPAKLPAEMRTPPEELLVGGQDEHASLLLAPSPMSGRPTRRCSSTARPKGGAVRAKHRTRSALAEAGVRVRLVPIEGAAHIINGHHDIDAVVRLSVAYLAEALRPGS